MLISTLEAVSTLLSLQNILEDRDNLTYAQREDLIAHEIVSVWEKDPHKLRCLSKALSMKLDEVDCKRLYMQQLEKARKIWVQMGKPTLNKCGGKLTPEFLVSSFFT